MTAPQLDDMTRIWDEYAAQAKAAQDAYQNAMDDNVARLSEAMSEAYAMYERAGMAAWAKLSADCEAAVQERHRRVDDLLDQKAEAHDRAS